MSAGLCAGILSLLALALTLSPGANAAAPDAEACGPFGNPPAAMHGSVKPACGSGETLGPWKDGDGTDRYACLYEPSTVAAGARLPLLIYLHPSLFGSWTVSHTNLLDLQNRALLGGRGAGGFIVLAPQGRDTAHRYPWPDNNGVGWDNWYRQLNPGGAVKLGAAVYPENVDAATIDHFVTQTARTGRVDTRRIYMTGWSNGAAMGLLYALSRPNVAAAAIYSAPDPFGAFGDPCAQKPVNGAPANEREVPIFNPHVAVMNLHNACDIAGICPNTEKMAAELRSAGIEVEDVIIEADGRRVVSCSEYCGADPNGGLSLLHSPVAWFIGLHRHESWPAAWAPAMLEFLRAHPLRPAAAQF